MWYQNYVYIFILTNEIIHRRKNESEKSVDLLLEKKMI